LNVANRIRFGEVPHHLLLKATASADIGIYLIEAKTLSYKFSLPNKFFEFVMAELPVIIGRLPEMEKIVMRYECGFAVNPDDFESIAQIVHRMVSDRDFYETIRANTMSAKKDLCWENEERKLVQLYEQMM
jgi:glycosyltransferase involved in cell wall biosynthesis